MKREDRNSHENVESYKSCNRNLDNVKMKKALNFVNENNFEKELMERLERMENKMKVVSNTIKEEKYLNQEDRYYNEEDKDYEVQEDMKQANYDENFSCNSVQEDYQIQKLLETDLEERENQMSVEKFLNEQSQEKKETESVVVSEMLVDAEDQVPSDRTMCNEKLYQIKEQAVAKEDIESNPREINNIADDQLKVKRRNRFVKKLCSLKKFVCTRKTSS